MPYGGIPACGQGRECPGPHAAEHLPEYVEQRVADLESANGVGEHGLVAAEQLTSRGDEAADRGQLHVEGVELVDGETLAGLAQARGELVVVQGVLLQHVDSAGHQPLGD